MNAEESMLQEGCPSVPRARLGKADMRGSGITELRLISGVNEAVKVAIEASEKIGLLAINANLMAGRAGPGLVRWDFAWWRAKCVASATAWQ